MTPRYELSAEAKERLSAVGWSEGYDASPQVDHWSASLDGEFVLFPAARDALQRYGGLYLHLRGTGIECGRSGFDMNPMRADGEGGRFQDFEAPVTAALYPLGESRDGHFFLAIAPDGRVFELMQEIWLLGNTVEEAIDALILGRLGQHIG